MSKTMNLPTYILFFIGQVKIDYNYTIDISKYKLETLLPWGLFNTFLKRVLSWFQQERNSSLKDHLPVEFLTDRM